MSQGVLRRADKAMTAEEIETVLRESFVGHFATVSVDGSPYVVPNLFVFADGDIYSHTTLAQGHFRENIDRDTRVCFEVAVQGEVYPYGEFECDTTISFRSVICFGQVKVMEEPEEKIRFFDRFMAKYAGQTWDRPKGFYPRLEQVTVYCLKIEQMTGKRTPLPSVSERWPAKNTSRTPHAQPPRRTEAQGS